MMSKSDRYSADSAQDKVARRYRRLGYDVISNPSSDDLPAFMRGVMPDIVARSKSDNVVIEVKKSGSLKGANELVSIADRIFDHPDWRFELIVLDDKGDRSEILHTNFDRIVENARLATRFKLFDLAYVYLGTVLVGTAHQIARASGLKVRNKTDRDLFHDLAFKGILPQDMTEASLHAISVRDMVSNAHGDASDVSEQDVKALLDLCEGLRTFL